METIKTEKQSYSPNPSLSPEAEAAAELLDRMMDEWLARIPGPAESRVRLATVISKFHWRFTDPETGYPMNEWGNKTLEKISGRYCEPIVSDEHMAQGREFHRTATAAIALCVLNPPPQGEFTEDDLKLARKLTIEMRLLRWILECPIPRRGELIAQMTTSRYKSAVNNLREESKNGNGNN